MAGSPRPVRDLYDVEDLLLLRPSKRSRGKVEIPRCRLEEEAAINAAIKLKSMVDSGDVSLVNPDVLASKLRAKDAIEEAIKEMVEKQMEWSSRETQEVDACIAILKNRPRRRHPPSRPVDGAPGQEESDRSLHLPRKQVCRIEQFFSHTGLICLEFFSSSDLFGPYPLYDLSAGVNEVEFTAAQEEEARASAVQSQRALWTMNLKAHEAKKTVLEEYAPKVKKAFQELLADTLREPSFIGAGDGYADYGFLSHTGQLR
uniref:Uncharacterized protein n=1 Tax=Aegilops tauschii TaxID=37682 RepID=N1QZY2_AEGTA